MPSHRVSLRAPPRYHTADTVCVDVTPDDGNLAVVVVDGACSRLDTIGLAMAMKKGVFLGEDPTRCRTFVVPEFKITPTDAKSPYNIDGDPHAHGPVHVKVLHQALTMFCLPSQGSSSSAVAAQVCALWFASSVMAHCLPGRFSLPQQPLLPALPVYLPAVTAWQPCLESTKPSRRSDDARSKTA